MVTTLSMLSVRLSVAVTANGPAASDTAFGVMANCNVGTSLSIKNVLIDAELCFAAVTVNVTISSTFGTSSSKASTVTSTFV